MRKNQKGFTIVELLIAITILSIVVAVVCGFILVGSRSYAAGNSDINIQQEAQLALNQMSDVMIDTTRSVNYIGYDAAGNPEHALKDAEFPFTPEDKSLILFNGVVVKDPSGGADTMEEGNGNKHYHFYWNKTQETLFYAEQNVNSSVVESVDIMSNFPNVTDADPDADPASTRWYVLAQHVTDFSVDLSQVEEKRVVQLALTFVDGRKEYVTSNNVTIRNKVGVNDAEIAPLDRKVEIDVVVKPSVILEPGETFVLPTPKVTGKNVTDMGVTWSFVGTPSDDGPGPDGSAVTSLTTDGILKLSVKAKGSFKVKAEANAENSDGSHSSAEVTVNVKRVLSIGLSKTSDSNPNNGPNEISPGCTFTVSANVTGDFLDQTCDACGDDTSIDRHALTTNNKPGIDGGNRVWRVWDPHLAGEEWYLQNDPTLQDWYPSKHIKLQDQNEYNATFKVEPDVPDGGTHGYRIQAVSLLSFYRPYGSPTYKGRFYDWVMGGLDLTVVKGSEDAEPYGGALKYGEQTLDEKIREGLPTDYNKYVTAIRVVDNSGKQPDRVLLHFTIGGGNNYRICPDLFDLDLNGSYTFYMQALFPIAEDRYVPGRGGEADDKATIEQEYFSNLNTSKPYGYVGTRYRHGKVFYAKLDRPKLSYEYKGVKYSGKNITYDPVNIYSVGVGSGIVGEIRPVGYENIVEDNSAWNYISNSLYKGEGSNQSQWEKLYYTNEDSIVDKTNIYNNQNLRYFGNNTLANGAVQIDPKGSMFMKLNNKNNLLEVCGDYHIVPGMVYQNRDPGSYEIIAWRGFDFPHLPREVRYYEFDDSTIHVKVDTLFNLELWSYYDNQFTKGEIHFPTPSETEFTSYFNRENLEWQNAKKLDWFVKSINGSDQTTYYVPSSMRCRYVADRKLYELELFYNYTDSTWNRSVEVSAGVFQCAVDGNRWERKTPGTYDSLLEQNKKPQVDGSTADMDFKVWDQEYKGKMYIPLPSESAFTGKGWNELGFEKKKPGYQYKQDFALLFLKNGEQNTQYMWNIKLTCIYDASTDEYTMQLRDSNDNWIAAYICKSDGNRWRQWGK